MGRLILIAIGLEFKREKIDLYGNWLRVRECSVKQQYTRGIQDTRSMHELTLMIVRV